MDILEVNEQEFEIYQSYRVLYEAQHPYPEKRNEFDWRDAGLIFKGKVITTVAAVLLAGFRTAEQFYLAASNQGNVILGWAEALLAVMAIEGLILFLAADRAKRRGHIHEWTSWAGIGLALIVSLLAGLGQSMRLIEGLNVEILGWFNLALAIGLAFASFVAYIGGEIIGQELARIDIANEGNSEEFKSDIERWEKSLQASWSRSHERKKVRESLVQDSQKIQKVAQSTKDWRHLSHDEKIRIAQLTPKQVETGFQVERRTSYNWVDKAQEYAQSFVYGEE